jgi:hypothetical protein
LLPSSPPLLLSFFSLFPSLSLRRRIFIFKWNPHLSFLYLLLRNKQKRKKMEEVRERGNRPESLEEEEGGRGRNERERD